MDEDEQCGESDEQIYTRLTQGMKRADVLLLLIEQHCVSFPGSYWSPPLYADLLKVGRESARIVVSGAGDATILRSLERRGLIEKPIPTQFDHPGRYSYFITESGKLRAQELV